jgi:antitoxin component YwqK of YwqJK toxin-antitoxin module
MFSEQKEKLEERKFWHENGQLQSQEFYRAGKLEGESKWWYENGQLASRGFFQNGKLKGESKWWYENGQIWSQVFHRDGKLEGEFKSWYKNGQPESQAFYRDGKIIDVNFYFAKKSAFLRIRKRFLNRAIFPLDTMLITDLRGSCLPL